MTNQTELVCPVKSTSDKVYNFAQGGNLKKNLRLPSKDYGPICMKILKSFIKHHKLLEDLPVPEKGHSAEQALAKIFDIMLYSMGDEKRETLLKESEEYFNSIDHS